MDYKLAVEQIELLGFRPDRVPGLGPVRRTLLKTGLVDRVDPKKTIIIAGTNGKGSTAATLAQLLSTTGARVGLYTSPHLVTTRERMRVNDREVSEEQFTDSYLAVRDVICEEDLNYFEALTLIAAHLFFSGACIPPVQWSIWEVGMGGLFDATNAIPHHYCAITRLGLDHQGVLGKNLEEIARQKFGVIPDQGIVVYSPMSTELSLLRDEFTAKTSCQWIEAKPVRRYSREPTPGNRLATIWGEAMISLPGPRATENAATALTLFEAMGFDPSHSLHALAEIRWPGRFSRFGVERFPCPAYASGDHNLQGIESLIELLSSHSWETLHLVVGIGQDKDAEAMLERLWDLPRSKLYLTETPFKPLPLKKYPARFLQIAADQDADVSHLLARISAQASERDLIVVTGSLYLVGQVLADNDTLLSEI